MAFDFKKEYRQFYRPGTKPGIVTIPKMNYLAVKGKGDPNPENSEYKKSISLLYGVAYTLKMSYKTDHAIDGFFQYVVPPLEGLWWQDHAKRIDYSRKDDFHFFLHEGRASRPSSQIFNETYPTYPNSCYTLVERYTTEHVRESRIR